MTFSCPFTSLEVRKLLSFCAPAARWARGSIGVWPRQVRGQLPDVLYAVDGQTASQRGLARVFRRDVQLLHSRARRAASAIGSTPGTGAQLALQTQLTEERAAFLRQT